MDFRCWHCGGNFPLELPPPEQLACPHCGREIAVPRQWRALPRPGWRGEAAEGGQRISPAEWADHVGPVESAGRRPRRPRGRSGRDRGPRIPRGLAAVAVSLAVHVLLAAAFVFLTLSAAPTPSNSHAHVVEAVFPDRPAGVLAPPEPAEEPAVEALERPDPLELAELPDSAVVDPAVVDPLAEDSIAPDPADAPRSPAEAPAGPVDPFADAAPEVAARPVRFFGMAGDQAAEHVVYVIDASGSMVGPQIARAKRELVDSIRRLAPRQHFHVIFYAGERPLESPPGRLTAATDAAKLRFVDFLDGVTVGGSVSDPRAALRRAFDALARAAGRSGGVIYLLSDGEFTVEPEAMLTFFRRMNGRRNVRVHTLLLDTHPAAQRLMRRIAAEHGGEFAVVAAQ
jgi:hypothetical protein